MKSLNYHELMYAMTWYAHYGLLTKKNSHVWTERFIGVFTDCTMSYCACCYTIDGALTQMKPCHVSAEYLCRGDVDPDWEYLLRGAYFRFHVIDEICDSTYNKSNYGSITKGDTGIVMLGRLQNEIDDQLLTVVEKPCVCIHRLGAVPKGHDDFRNIIDCSSPEGICVNDYTQGFRTNFCLLQLGGVCK